MTTINPIQHRPTVQNWLADAFNANADWRDVKAQEYPDDQRNARTANALRGAANYVRHAHSSPGVERFVELDKACGDSGLTLMVGESLPGEESQQVASRYFFDSLNDVASATSHERLLLDLYDAALSDLRDFSLSAESPLGRLLAPEANQLGLGRDDGRVERIVQLQRVADALLGLDEMARLEGDEEGRLPQSPQPTRIPLMRKRLTIELSALRALGGPDIATATQLVNEPPLFMAGVGSKVLNALDEVNHALEAETTALE